MPGQQNQSMELRSPDFTLSFAETHILQAQSYYIEQRQPQSDAQESSLYRVITSPEKKGTSSWAAKLRSGHLSKVSSFSSLLQILVFLDESRVKAKHKAVAAHRQGSA